MPMLAPMETLRSTDAVAVGDGRDHALGHHPRPMLVIAGQQHHVLVAAEPRHDERLMATGGQATRHLLEHRITGGMPERIVGFLEAVEIDHQNVAPGSEASVCDRHWRHALRSAGR